MKNDNLKNESNNANTRLATGVTAKNVKGKKIKMKDCQINVFERDKFCCNLECIMGYDCVHYR